MNPNHPANNVERKGNYLEGGNIWLGITGSVSCVETIGITRELLRYGANVTIVANKAALELVGEKALEFACGKPIIKEISSDKNLNIKKGNVVFDKVSFSYPNTQEQAIENINITVEGGTTVALVGHSGAGKSTIMNLLPRFYRVFESDYYNFYTEEHV